MWDARGDSLDPGGAVSVPRKPGEQRRIGVAYVQIAVVVDSVERYCTGQGSFPLDAGARNTVHPIPATTTSRRASRPGSRQRPRSVPHHRSDKLPQPLLPVHEIFIQSEADWARANNRIYVLQGA